MHTLHLRHTSLSLFLCLFVSRDESPARTCATTRRRRTRLMGHLPHASRRKRPVKLARRVIGLLVSMQWPSSIPTNAHVPRLSLSRAQCGNGRRHASSLVSRVSSLSCVRLSPLSCPHSSRVSLLSPLSSLLTPLSSLLSPLSSLLSRLSSFLSPSSRPQDAKGEADGNRGHTTNTSVRVWAWPS